MTFFDYILLFVSVTSFAGLIYALGTVPEFLINHPRVGQQIKRRLLWVVVPLLIVAYRVWG